MNIIFLDFDGVLNNTHEFKRWQSLKMRGALPLDLAVTDCIDSNNVECLNNLIIKTDAKCVASTTWRLWWSVDKMQKHLERFGFKGKIIDVTPNLNGKPRGDEILVWLNNSEIDVDSFVILDDLSTVTMDKFLVQTNDNFGLTKDDVEKAISKMGVRLG